MSYRTTRPRTRKLLTFGVGATLAITQLGAGCVPADRARRCRADSAVDDAGECAPAPGPTADPGDGGGDAR